MSTPLHLTHIMEATAGGSRKHLRYLVTGQRAAGHTVDLILSPRLSDPDFSQDLRAYNELGCHVKLVDMRKSPGPWDVAAWRAVRRILAARRPQIVHTHCAKAGLLGRLAARSVDPGMRTVHTPHSFFFQGMRGSTLRGLGIRLERHLGQRTDLLLCISESEREQALTHHLVSAPRIEVALNGLPADYRDGLLTRLEARKALGLAEDAVAVAVVTRLVPRKGLLWIPDAVAALPEATRRRLRLLLIGAGPLRHELESRVRTLNLRSQITCLGYLPAAERFLPGFDVAVVSSYYEGLSYSLLEALAAGLPVIATDVPGNRLELGDNPIRYVAPDDAEALSKGMERLAGDGDLRRELGSRSRSWVGRHFSLERQLAQVEAAYRKLLKDGTRS